MRRSSGVVSLQGETIAHYSVQRVAARQQLYSWRGWKLAIYAKGKVGLNLASNIGTGIR